MLSKEQLLVRRCQPVEGAALSEAEVRSQLAAFRDWGLRGGSIVRTYRFANYYETIAFINALAYVVHAEDHHPELLVGYDRCEVRFNTHSVKGISENDFICAAKADAVYAQRATPQKC